jgi:hypothetical protein
LLTPIVAVSPDYAGGNAKRQLYEAYLGRAKTRHAASDVVGALSDYEAALGLNVPDPSEAQMNRAELLLAFAQEAETVRPTPAPFPTFTSDNTDTETPGSNDNNLENGEEPEEEEATPEPVRIRYRAPELISPENDTIFGGEFAEVIVQWEPIGRLAADEYYDLTVMHIFADEPHYWGLATKDTRVQLDKDIGVGKAGGDRFYWWVTVRKANSAPSSDSIDLPVSRQSEGRTFIWSP